MEAYVIPDIYCPFPAHISPHFEEVRRHALEWAKDLRLIQKEMTQQHYLAENLIEWTCRIHPKADLQALFVIANGIPGVLSTMICLIILKEGHN